MNNYERASSKNGTSVKIALKFGLGFSWRRREGFVRIRTLANERRTNTTKADTRTPHPKPTELLNKLLSRMGKPMPPIDEPIDGNKLRFFLRRFLIGLTNDNDSHRHSSTFTPMVRLDGK